MSPILSIHPLPVNPFTSGSNIGEGHLLDRLADKSGSMALQATVLREIGEIYLDRHAPKDAVPYFERSIEKARQPLSSTTISGWLTGRSAITGSLHANFRRQ
jgi:hypothetical protein